MRTSFQRSKRRQRPKLKPSILTARDDEIDRVLDRWCVATQCVPKALIRVDDVMESPN
jgi:hypothetical protein